jgi:hypothetical protein
VVTVIELCPRLRCTVAASTPWAKSRVVQALVLADLTTLAVRANDFDRATALAGDAIDVTVRTETSLARQRLLTLASALATSSDPSAAGALRDHIVFALRR